jgi:hypothetical protein
MLLTTLFLVGFLVNILLGDKETYILFSALAAPLVTSVSAAARPVRYDELRQALKGSERLAKVRDPAKKKNGGGGGANAGSLKRLRDWRPDAWLAQVPARV